MAILAACQYRNELAVEGGRGRACLLMAAIGLIGAGFTIQAVGMTSVFVPTDLTFMA